MGLFFGIISPNVFFILKKARKVGNDYDLNKLKQAIYIYHLKYGKFPETLDELYPEFIKNKKYLKYKTWYEREYKK